MNKNPEPNGRQRWRIIWIIIFHFRFKMKCYNWKAEQQQLVMKRFGQPIINRKIHIDRKCNGEEEEKKWMEKSQLQTTWKGRKHYCSIHNLCFFCSFWYFGYFMFAFDIMKQHLNGKHKSQPWLVSTLFYHLFFLSTFSRLFFQFKNIRQRFYIIIGALFEWMTGIMYANHAHWKS